MSIAVVSQKQIEQKYTKQYSNFNIIIYINLIYIIMSKSRAILCLIFMLAYITSSKMHRFPTPRQADSLKSS